MSWFKNLRTVVKLLLAFGLMAVLTGIVGYKGVAAAGDIDAMLEKLYDKDLMGISAIQNANVTRLQIAYSVRYAMGTKDKAQKQLLGAKVTKGFGDLDEALVPIDQTLETDEGKALLAKIRETMPLYKKMCEEAMALTLEGKDDEAAETLRSGQSLVEGLPAEFRRWWKPKKRQARKPRRIRRALCQNAKHALYDHRRGHPVLYGDRLFHRTTDFETAAGHGRRAGKSCRGRSDRATGSGYRGRSRKDGGRPNRATESIRATLAEVRTSATTCRTPRNSWRRHRNSWLRARRNKLPVWKRPAPPWRRLPPPSSKMPTMPSRPIRLPMVPATRRRRVVRWSPRRWERWARSTSPRRTLPKSSAPSTRSLFKPICSR